MSILIRRGVEVAVEVIKLEDVKKFVAEAVEVSIQDYIGEEQMAPFIKKQVTKYEICPDHTHLRLFFDDKNFFAVPLTAEVTVSDTEWIAYDSTSNLYYVMRKVD